MMRSDIVQTDEPKSVCMISGNYLICPKININFFTSVLTRDQEDAGKYSHTHLTNRTDRVMV